MMSNYHETTLGEAIATFSESEMRALYYIMWRLIEDKVRTFEEYEELLSKLPQQKAYVANTLISCGARGGGIAKIGAKVTNRDIEAWTYYIKNHSAPCLFVTVE